jgi:hypothetical protein
MTPTSRSGSRRRLYRWRSRRFEKRVIETEPFLHLLL